MAAANEPTRQQFIVTYTCIDEIPGTQQLTCRYVDHVFQVIRLKAKDIEFAGTKKFYPGQLVFLISSETFETAQQRMNEASLQAAERVSLKNCDVVHYLHESGVGLIYVYLNGASPEPICYSRALEIFLNSYSDDGVKDTLMPGISEALEGL
ncbi:hypothetical protein [Roseibium sediminis]|uniref:hypothetical protein n=1 Tax=Roseibium sediminis TaxID=1775174 RepID=UPI00123D12B2|nr:hypothetical protein [Roseibium sediminis]